MFKRHKIPTDIKVAISLKMIILLCLHVHSVLPRMKSALLIVPRANTGNMHLPSLFRNECTQWSSHISPIPLFIVFTPPGSHLSAQHTT